MFDDDTTGRTSEYYFPDENDCRTCNVCAGNCPTFSIHRESLESPRGRLKLKLIKKVLRQGETLVTEEQTHLDNCVQFRACESVCPSKMQYADLLYSAREQLAQPTTPTLIRALLYVTSDRTRLNQLFTTLRNNQFFLIRPFRTHNRLPSAPVVPVMNFALRLESMSATRQFRQH